MEYTISSEYITADGKHNCLEKRIMEKVSNDGRVYESVDDKLQAVMG